MDIMKKYGTLIGNICLYDETFEEFLPGLIWGMQETNKGWQAKHSPPDKNPYSLCKSQLETLLTKRNLDEIEEVMLKSENQRTPSEQLFDNPTDVKRSKEINAQFLERIYHEIYKDDPEYKAELVKTPVEELLKMHF